MPEKILITGAAGFIGYNMACELLNKTDSLLYLVDNLQRGRWDTDFERLVENPRVEFYKRDLRSPKAFSDLPDVNYIFHLAAIVGVRNVVNNASEVLKTNLLATLGVIDYARECSNLRGMTFSSTSEVYAGTLKHFGAEIPTPEDTPITLTDLNQERTTYALSKITGEVIFNIDSIRSQVPTTIVRYHNIYGPRMGYMHVIPELYYRMRQHQEVEVFSPFHTRSFCFIEDAVRMTRILSLASSENGTYNIGNASEELSIMTLAGKIRDVEDMSCKLIPGNVTQGSPERRCPDIEKLEIKLGRQEFITLDDGLKKTVEWYRDRLGERFE
ncbi:MAG: NAD-binding protein [Acidiferrobacteraceae bacterium]|mgnify:CR=1 FL=1|nr:NAD-binding protein [Acidiferrobacteraceae bacterium]|tara:strand:- start:127 stop:1110 length:984 start_codon:yes stop_codon:yes gene_type:complete